MSGRGTLCFRDGYPVELGSWFDYDRVRQIPPDPLKLEEEDWH